MPSPSLSYLAINAILISIKIIITSESPEPRFQLLPFVNSCSITFPIKSTLLPPRIIADNKCCKCRYKYHCYTADNTRNTERYYNLCNCLHRIGTRGLWRHFMVLSSIVFKYIVYRQYHKKAIIIHHTKHNGGRCIDDI